MEEVPTYFFRSPLPLCGTSRRTASSPVNISTRWVSSSHSTDYLSKIYHSRLYLDWKIHLNSLLMSCRLSIWLVKVFWKILSGKISSLKMRKMTYLIKVQKISDIKRHCKFIISSQSTQQNHPHPWPSLNHHSPPHSAHIVFC